MAGIGVGGGSGGFTGVDRVVEELTKGMERASGLNCDNTLPGGTGGDEKAGGEKGERVHTGCELDYKKSSDGGAGASSGAGKIRDLNVENRRKNEGRGGNAMMEKEGRDPRGLKGAGPTNDSSINTRAVISDVALSKVKVVDELGKNIDVELLNDEDSRYVFVIPHILVAFPYLWFLYLLIT